MKIPEFTAEASLYESSNRHRSLGQRGQPQGPGVIPQRGGKEFKGYEGCIMDCLDSHPYLSRAQCARNCNDPFGGTDLSTRGSWVNDLLSSGGISLWEGACGIMAHPTLCGWAADVMRRQS